MTCNKDVFARNLKHYLTLSGLSQRDLATRIGVNEASVSFWCAGQKFPRIDKIEKIATVFGVKKSDLIEDKNIPAVLIDKEIASVLDDIQIQANQMSLGNKQFLLGLLKNAYDMAEKLNKDDK